MPEIRPFRAWRYNPARVRDFSRVLAPPYDVISPAEQKRLYARSPHNVIRIELGMKKPSDGAGDNAYVRARRFLEAWKEEGVLIRDDRPALYVYVQDYPEGHGQKRRFGFFASMRLDEKAVKKHEKTLAGPKKDRLRLLKEVRTNTSPIFGLFEDAGKAHALLKTSARGRPVLDVTLDAVRHRIYVQNDTKIVQELCRCLRSKPMYIADGHHRFEVACQFHRWARQKHSAGDSAYVLAYLADCRHNPFTIFPTHRLLRLPKGKRVLDRLRSRGVLRRASGLGTVLRRLAKPRDESGDKKYSFGVFTKKNGFFIFELGQASTRFKSGDEIGRLDVSVLHERVFGPCFGLRTADKAGVDFTRSAEEACRKVRAGFYDAAFFLRPTSLGEMIHASKKGLRMPQKSTYFYPKLLTGLALHSL